MTSQQEVDAHRADLATLTATAANDIATFYAGLKGATSIRDGLLAFLPRLLATYGSAAGTLGADWYDDLRDAVKAKGRFRATPAGLPGDAQIQKLTRWAVSPLFEPSPTVQPGEARPPAPDPTVAFEKTLANVQGGTQRLITNVDRQTVTTAAIKDPAAEGWQRAGTGACPFCQMLISRGAVYKRASVDFGAHRGCHCVGVPAFGGQPLPVKPYTPTSRNITAADRARVRRWIKANQE